MGFRKHTAGCGETLLVTGLIANGYNGEVWPVRVNSVQGWGNLVGALDDLVTMNGIWRIVCEVIVRKVLVHTRLCLIGNHTHVLD
jgi:hypothetical protein